MAFLGVVVAATAVMSAKPNFIVFYADDLGWGDPGCYGHPTSDTPNIDKLAAEGMRFASIYTSSPVCSPSRAGLLTGRYQTRSGIYPGVVRTDTIGGLPHTENTFASLLQDAGYLTGMVGKWHLGVGANWSYLPTHHGFDEYTGLPYSVDMGAPATCFARETDKDVPCFPGTNPEPMHTTCHVGEERDAKVEAPASETVQLPLFQGTKETMRIVQQPADLTTLDAVYNEAAVGFVERSAASGSPFLLYYAFSHVHFPQYAGEQFFNTTDRGMYGDGLTALDWSLGEVMAALERTGQGNNTLVFFASDNGPWLVEQQRGGSAGLLRCGKETTWEGGQRVPGIVRWPGRVAAGVLTREIASTMDMFPTILKIAGVTPPEAVYDSYDMSPFLFAPDGVAPAGTTVRDHFVYLSTNVENINGIYAVRYKEWKLHYFLRGGGAHADYFVESCRGGYSKNVTDAPLLFNLNHDAGEHVPLDSSAPMYAAVIKAITEVKETLIASKGLFGPSVNGKLDPLVQPCIQPNCTDAATMRTCCVQ